MNKRTGWFSNGSRSRGAVGCVGLAKLQGNRAVPYSEKVIMLQSEIAGRLAASPNEYPAKGRVIRDFQLPSSGGEPVLLSSYRGRSNMVLVLAGASDSAGELLSDLAMHQSELKEDETCTLAVAAGPRQHATELKRAFHLNFEVLADVDGQVHRTMGTWDRTTRIRPAVFITDRFGEVFAGFNVAQGANLPSMKEILSWIDFINSQCPECGPVEWLD
jgi:peroxiredoxin